MNQLSSFEDIVGELRVVEVFVHFDIPRLFVSQNQAGQYYLVNWLGEEEGADSWLYSAISPERYSALRTCDLDIATAFIKAESRRVYKVVEDPQSSTVHWEILSISDIKPDMLPTAGKTLPNPMPPLPVIPNPADVSTARQRGVLNLTFRSKATLFELTQLPISALGGVFKDLQSLLNSLALSIKGGSSQFGQIAYEMIHPVQFDLASTYSGSFGVHLSSSSQLSSDEQVILTQSLTEFIALLKSTENEDFLKEKLKGIQARARIRFKDFLEALIETDADLDVSSATPSWPIMHSTLQIQKVKDAYAVIKHLDIENLGDVEIIGTLVTYSSSKHTFELLKDDGVQYNGRIDRESLPNTMKVTVPSRYMAKIRQKLRLQKATGAESVEYTLHSLEPSH